MQRSSRRTNITRSVDPHDIPELDTVMEFNVPGVSYISEPGIKYYRLDVIDPGEQGTPITIPVAACFNLNIEVKGLKAEVANTGDDPVRRIMALVYNAPEEGTAEVYTLQGQEQGSPFLDGNVLFFQYSYNPDPQTETEVVNRIAALGLTSDDQFGFFRVIDTFGDGFPGISNTDSDFQIFASPITYGQLYKELVVDAGSPAALCQTSRTRGAR